MVEETSNLEIHNYFLLTSYKRVVKNSEVIAAFRSSIKYFIILSQLASLSQLVTVCEEVKR